MKSRTVFLISALAMMSACSAPGTETIRPDRTMKEQTFEDCDPITEVPVKLIKAKAPVFPVQRLVAKQQGYAVIDFDVSLEGRAENIKNVKSSHKSFYVHAKLALQEWEFEPAHQDGEPIRVRCQLRQAFRLR